MRSRRSISDCGTLLRWAVCVDPLGQGCGEAEGAVYRCGGEVTLFLQCFFEYLSGGCCWGDVPLVGCGLETAG